MNINDFVANNTAAMQAAVKANVQVFTEYLKSSQALLESTNDALAKSLREDTASLRKNVAAMMKEIQAEVKGGE